MGSVTKIFKLIIILLLNSVNSDIGCHDNEGKLTPWFYVYKLPKLDGVKDPNFESGLGYYYFGPESKDWVKSSDSINDSTSVIGRTLADLHQNGHDLAHIAYNDHPPGQPKIKIDGHTKGVLVTNNIGGFWLQHSVPQFPILPAVRYEYQMEETARGQIFICISLNTSQIDDIPDILAYVRPITFSHSIPPSLSILLPKLLKFVERNGTTTAPESPRDLRIFNLTVDRWGFKIFTKGPEIHQEVFLDWISPTLETNLAVQSWLERKDRLPSNCTGNFEVCNVKQTGFDTEHFSAAKDHSKWAVSLNASKPWTCISDLNRRWNQRYRGGLAICALDSKIWSSFRKIILQIEPCTGRESEVANTDATRSLRQKYLTRRTRK